MKKNRKLKIIGIEIILTNENIVFEDGINLKDETGWWENNKIYIYTQGLKSLQKFGILTHELVEMLLVKKLYFRENLAHFIANIFEFIITLGKPVNQVWKRYSSNLF